MKKLKMIFRYLKRMDFKNMFKIIGQVSNKSKKLKILIFFDMVYCGIRYGAGYYDYQEFEFYLLSNKERKTYLTRTKNNLIVKEYNDPNFFKKFDDKAIFNDIFNEYLKRDYLVINQRNFKEFNDFVKKHKTLIVKPLDGSGGEGIEKIVITSKTNIKKIYENLLANKQYLIEECIVQHHELDKLYDGSVNTLRLFTFFDGKHSYLLNSVFKIGNGGVTDNFSSGSMYTFVNEEGMIIVPAIDQNDNTFTVHPLTNMKIIDFKVPLYKEACAMVLEASKLVPEVKYIGWDVAISEKGPIIIEGNSFPGVFQIKPSFGLKKEGLIPKYQKVMKIE